ncbi:hypothetical protein [Gordonia neofelifaecis]|uniref:hypothetical protein n=1 Tax=Gordonia neofelifaecis TaxID=945692 RepID=UPI0002ED578F|nr:hypothetical protein [Gordonia neofelifaecis]
MGKQTIYRWSAVAAAALAVSGISACDRGVDTTVSSSASPSVVTVTKSVVQASDGGSSTATVAPTVSAENPPSDVEETPRSDLAQYYGEWTGHGRDLVLDSDGTATVSLAAGAADVEKWTATWGAHGNGIVVTLSTMTWHTGEPLGNRPGQSWTGILRPADEDGVTVLHMPGFTDWCSTRFGRSVVCGA